jgi:hypothetical protein
LSTIAWRPAARPQAGGIVHDDEAEVERHGEETSAKAVPEADRGGERRDGGRVGARHAAGLDEPRMFQRPVWKNAANPL